MSEVGPGSYAGLILGQAFADTEVDTSPIAEGPFMVLLGPDPENPRFDDSDEVEELFIVFPTSLADSFEQVFDAEPGAAGEYFISGVDDGMHALLSAEDFGEEAMIAGPADLSGASRLAWPYWLVTETGDGAPVATVYGVPGLEEVISIPGARSFDVATAERLDGDHVGVLASIVIADTDRELGDCALPANRSVLLELELPRQDP